MVLFPPETVDVSTVRGTNSAGWLHSHTEEMPAAFQSTGFGDLLVHGSGCAANNAGWLQSHPDKISVQGLGCGTEITDYFQVDTLVWCYKYVNF